MIDWQSLWQNLLSNIAWAALVAVVGIIVARLKLRGSKFVGPILVGLVGAALTLFIVLQVRYLFTPVQTPATRLDAGDSRKTEERLYAWLRKTTLSAAPCRNQEAKDQVMFCIQVTKQSLPYNVFVYQTKADPEIITFLLGPQRQLSENMKQRLNALSPADQLKAKVNIGLDLLRLGVGEEISGYGIADAGWNRVTMSASTVNIDFDTLLEKIHLVFRSALIMEGHLVLLSGLPGKEIWAR